jgi:hypothetical protein
LWLKNRKYSRPDELVCDGVAVIGVVLVLGGELKLGGSLVGGFLSLDGVPISTSSFATSQ